MSEAKHRKEALSDRKIEPPAPTKYAWYNGELIASTDRLTECDRLNLLDTHPLFTERNPEYDCE